MGLFNPTTQDTKVYDWTEQQLCSVLPIIDLDLTSFCVCCQLNGQNVLVFYFLFKKAFTKQSYFLATDAFLNLYFFGI